jgi:hypothetical protein
MLFSRAAALPIKQEMARALIHHAPARALALRWCAALAATMTASLLAAAAAGAETMLIGSPLSVPATLNTAEDLAYEGMNTQVPVSPEAPDGVFHTYHFGADTAIWNVPGGGGGAQAQSASAKSSAAVPADGQILQIRLKGCAEGAAGGPAPLTQIHFQDLSPLPGGGARVNISSQGFEIPVCGQGGASGSTVSSYEPVNLCVSRGDYVSFNDEGGYVEGVYHSGVPYEVLGSVRGSTADSFIRNGGTGDGADMSPSEAGAMEGFAVNSDEELLMQMVLGTGSDARYVCPGGTKDAPPVLAPMRISPQTDGINHQRIVEVAIYCRPASGCKGAASLTLARAGRSAARSVGHTQFDLPGEHTSHLAIRVAANVMRLIRKHHGVSTVITAVMNGQRFSQRVEIKIL